MEGRQHHTGVTMTDSKLTFGIASKDASMKSLASSHVVGRDGTTVEAVFA